MKEKTAKRNDRMGMERKLKKRLEKVKGREIKHEKWENVEAEKIEIKA